MESKGSNESLHAFCLASMIQHLKFSEERFPGSRWWKRALCLVSRAMSFFHMPFREVISCNQFSLKMLSFGDKWRYSCCLEQTIPPIVLNLIPWHHNNTQILTKMKTQSYRWCAVLQYRVKIIFRAKQSYKCNYDINVSQFNLYYKYILNFDDIR